MPGPGHTHSPEWDKIYKALQRQGYGNQKAAAIATSQIQKMKEKAESQKDKESKSEDRGE